MKAKTALLMGAGGLTGRHCLNFLLASDHYERVIALVREPLDLVHDRLEQRQVDYEDERSLGDLAGVNDVFCCLGAPLSRLGDHALVERVDYDYPYLMAQKAIAVGVQRFLIITSTGIGPRSPIHYCRVKDRIEKTLKQMPFTAVFAFRPSLLLGERSPDRVIERRAARIFRPFASLFRGPLGRYRPVEAAAVGLAMVDRANCGLEGFHVVQSGQMYHLFKQANA